MRPIHWLHISDFHLRQSESSPQDTVLTAMLDDIKRRCNQDLVFDFVLATGDFAFSGKKSEYALAENFFEQLTNLTGIPRKMIFCVPGNHDVDRDRQKMCFAGTRGKLQSQTDVYAFLNCDEERDTLLRRLSNFHEFQERFFIGQQRKLTDDNLGYVSVIDVDEIRIAIMGLNSAWLAEGGRSDHGQILLGEKQVMNAINIVNTDNPHLIIGMGHHPFYFFQDFDLITKHRLEETCDFFHCGHLHVPNASSVASLSGNCLMLAAGASFESREAHNAYTVIKLDPLRAQAEVTFVQYNPSDSAFTYEYKQNYPHELSAADPCSLEELAAAIAYNYPDANDLSYYLSALLLSAMSEIPIQTDDAIVFGTVDLTEQQSDDILATTTEEFLAVRRAITLLHGRKSLDEILTNYGSSIGKYAQTLEGLGESDKDLQDKLAARNTNARQLAGVKASGSFQYTSALLDELLAAEEWDKLREQAERGCELDDLATATKSKRMLALCLANSSEVESRQRATDLYRELVESDEGKAEDWAALATLLVDDGDNEQAKTAVMRAIETFPDSVDGFVQIGMKIVEATGNLEFREWLRSHKKN